MAKYKDRKTNNYAAATSMADEDIVLGLYYMSRERINAKGEGMMFADPDELRVYGVNTVAHATNEIGSAKRMPRPCVTAHDGGNPSDAWVGMHAFGHSPATTIFTGFLALSLASVPAIFSAPLLKRFAGISAGESCSGVGVIFSVFSSW